MPTAPPAPILKKKWLLDTAASHNIISNLLNLQLYSEFDGQDEVVIRDGTGLSVTHVGCTSFQTPFKKFILTNTLVPSIKHNFISIHSFTKSNKISVEFFDSFINVKDLIMEAHLLHGECVDGIYQSLHSHK